MTADQRAEEIHRKFCGCFLTMEGRARGDCQTFAAVAAALDAAREEALEEAAKVAMDARADEEYGHAAFRCVQIAENIRALKEAK